MRLGRMNTRIDIISTAPSKDAEGFVTQGDTVLASVRAAKETSRDTRNSETKESAATFSIETVTFKFRVIPGLNIDPTLIIVDADGRYNITSAQNAQGMYWECVAKKVAGSK